MTSCEAELKCKVQNFETQFASIQTGAVNTEKEDRPFTW